MASRGELAEPWRAVATITCGIALLAYAWFVFVVPRAFGQVEPIAPRAGLVYLASVAGMLVLIGLGSALLDRADVPDLRPALIVAAVGLHFLPFAAAFHTPMFKLLGMVMAAIGATGLVIGWIGDDRAASAAAVVSGVVMLAVITFDAARPSPTALT